MLVNTHNYGSTQRLEVLCNSAKEYIALLSEVRLSLKGEVAFPKGDLSLRQVKVCHFYRDAETHAFISIEAQRSKMLKLMAELTKEYHSCLHRSEKPAWLEYALRRGRTVMLNIDTLSSQMVIGEVVD